MSSQNFSFPLLVAANISTLNIASNGTKMGFGPVEELIYFEGLILNDLSDSIPISHYECSLIVWKIINETDKSIYKIYESKNCSFIVKLFL